MSRIQVPVADKPRQEIEQIAAQECRTVPVQTALLVELGLAARRQGYIVRNGELKKIQITHLKVS